MNQIYEINECAGKIKKTDETCNKIFFFNSICTVALHPFSSPLFNSAGFVEVAELRRVMGGNDSVTDTLIGEYDSSGDGVSGRWLLRKAFCFPIFFQPLIFFSLLLFFVMFFFLLGAMNKG